MTPSDFEKEYHWLYGLDEYYAFTGMEDKWLILRKAIMQNNWYRIRDVIMEFINRDYNLNDTFERDRMRYVLNVLFREHMPEVDQKAQNVSELIGMYMQDDQFIKAVRRFVDYWAGDGAEDAVMPDLNDFLSRGQVKSKLWLVTELAKVTEGPIGNVLFYGGWYNFAAFFLFNQFDVGTIYSLDVNRDVIEPSRRLYEKESREERFRPMGVNVNKIRWEGKTTYAPGRDSEEFVLCENSNIVINTSCEHMDNTWFENIPDGTCVLLQTNDYFSNEQHVNCCKDLEEVKQKYPMQSIMYEGELDTQLYNRFMLIGIK